MSESTAPQSGANPNPVPEKNSDKSPNPAAPAGTPSSVGAQSVRDGRPNTCDDVVEAMDEAGPGPK
jgi:hypothetical protein